jgi:hypothetical protein
VDIADSYYLNSYRRLSVKGYKVIWLLNPDSADALVKPFKLGGQFVRSGPQWAPVAQLTPPLHK